MKYILSLLILIATGSSLFSQSEPVKARVEKNEERSSKILVLREPKQERAVKNEAQDKESDANIQQAKPLRFERKKEEIPNSK